jgi:hypothetical protein
MGTKSLLFGAHCVPIHAAMIALAWTKLYGFPTDLRLWAAFILHDIGYAGCPNMDGPEGDDHPVRGALLMGRLFGRTWHNFTLYHSRFYAKRHGVAPSRLCIADKYVLAIEPWWLYLPRVIATGEIREYMTASALKDPRAYPNGVPVSRRAWHRAVSEYMLCWVEAHRDGTSDTWTPAPWPSARIADADEWDSGGECGTGCACDSCRLDQR